MTNNLANDMTRLRGEIAAMRDSRANLMSHLAETRAEMQAVVHQMVGGFAAARSDMTKQTKAELGEFVARVKGAVTDLRQTAAQLQSGFQDDLACAHRAWQGAPAAPRTGRTVIKTSFRAEHPSDEFTPKAKKKKR